MKKLYVCMSICGLMHALYADQSPAIKQDLGSLLASQENAVIKGYYTVNTVAQASVDAWITQRGLSEFFTRERTAIVHNKGFMMRIPTAAYGNLQQKMHDTYTSEMSKSMYDSARIYSAVGAGLAVAGVMIQLMQGVKIRDSEESGQTRRSILGCIGICGLGGALVGAAHGIGIPYPMQKIADLNKDEVLVSLDGLNVLLKSVHEKTGLYLREDETGFPLVESSSPSYPVAEKY